MATTHRRRLHATRTRARLNRFKGNAELSNRIFVITFNLVKRLGIFANIHIPPF